MKRFSLIIFILFSFPKNYLQSQVLPSFQLNEDTLSNQIVPNLYCQIAEDKDDKWTIDQVCQNTLEDHFQVLTKEINIEHQSFYWIRFKLKNNLSRDAKISFHGSNAAQFELYQIKTAEKIKKQITGDFIPWSKRDGFKQIESVPITIPIGEETIIYLRIKISFFYYYTSPNFSIGFGSTEKTAASGFIENNPSSFSTIRMTFLFGIMILGAIFSLLFFNITNEKIYLYFALMLIALAISRFNTILYLVLFREHPQVFSYLRYFNILFPDFFLVQFSRKFLQTSRHFPKWDKIINAIALINMTVIASTFFVVYLSGTEFNKIAFTVFDLFDSITLISVLITFTFLNREHNKSVKLLTIAALPALIIWGIGNLVVTIFNFNERYGFYNTSLVRWTNDWFYFIEMICIILLVIFFSWILLLRFVDLRKKIVEKILEKETERAELIAQQKVELEKQVLERTIELKQSLEDLKSTQAQLIQSEKMASLGELTAGIAHEIQNPLNFVNNFSEVNKELIDEIEGERSKVNGERDEELESELLSDIKQNTEKIIHHGKRADSIVKGMLQHSQKSIGYKEPTDINKLADEYLRLSYHGMRAKDKEFNVEIKTEFDEGIGKISVTPQDIGRVLLNLYNNAFYASSAKALETVDNNYKPTVTVTTKKLDHKVEVSVKDNGVGISQKIVDKIFQPFFTTKPTGQGTGLGLSLSYDIIKAQGGEIKVESKEGEGSEFMIQLPV